MGGVGGGGGGLEGCWSLLNVFISLMVLKAHLLLASSGVKVIQDGAPSSTRSSALAWTTRYLRYTGPTWYQNLVDRAVPSSFAATPAAVPTPPKPARAAARMIALEAAMLRRSQFDTSHAVVEAGSALILALNVCCRWGLWPCSAVPAWHSGDLVKPGGVKLGDL